MMDSQNKSSIRLNVAQLLNKMITEGNFKPGQRLPPERKLSQLLKVGRSSIREAIRTLEIIGLLESRRGSGNIVMCRPADIMTTPYGLSEQPADNEIMEILETRRALEFESVRLAAEKINIKQGKILQCFIGEMQIANCEAVAMAIEDGFHRQIVEFSGNRLLLSHYNKIVLMTNTIKKAEGNNIFSTYRYHKQMLKIHSELCDAIVAHQPLPAQVALESYFQILMQSRRK
ncbi:MAG: FadR family transcriptional regulator [Lentisphaerae bacterium]|nr:FadR family transcriptional regulator [Lentisphaerota bacterium]